MKLRVILELETIEQVGIILSTVNDWNINVDVSPIVEKITKKKTKKLVAKKKRNTKARGKMTRISKPDTLISSTGDRPSTLPELYDEAIPTIKQWPVRRIELAKHLAEVRGQSDTKATSTIVTKWIKQGAFKVV